MIDQSTAQGSFTILDEPESTEGKRVDKLPETAQSLASSGVVELDASDENSKCGELI